MAVRIPVVISQHERRSGSVADYEEQLVTRLIFENGLDATLIADLNSIAIDTTDHLCIEGLKGDFALASWSSAAYVCEHLHRLGMPSIEIVPVDGSPKMLSNQNGAIPKKIYFVSLATNVPIESTIRTLRDLREARSIPVFSIGLSPHEKKSSPATTLPMVSLVSALPVEPKKSSLSASSLLNEDVGVEDEEFPNIDQLMDDLDKFEI